MYPEVWDGFASAQVAEGPGAVLDCVFVVGLLHDADEWVHTAHFEDEVPILGAVACDVADGPNCLFCDVLVGAAEELDEKVDSALVDDGLGLLCGSAGYICEGPGGLEDQLGGDFLLDDFD